MEQYPDWDNIVGVVTGILGGMWVFMDIALVDITYFESLMKSGATAIVCGFMGVAGKHAYTWLKDKYLKKKKKNGGDKI